jgi:hypothetical protein
LFFQFHTKRFRIRQSGEVTYSGWVLTVHEPAAVRREVGLADDEVEIGDDLDDGEQRAVAVHAVHPDHRRVVGGIVIDHDPVNFARDMSVINEQRNPSKIEQRKGGGRKKRKVYKSYLLCSLMYRTEQGWKKARAENHAALFFKV